jgi:hypothetical protein
MGVSCARHLRFRLVAPVEPPPSAPPSSSAACPHKRLHAAENTYNTSRRTHVCAIFDRALPVGDGRSGAASHTQSTHRPRQCTRSPVPRTGNSGSIQATVLRAAYIDYQSLAAHLPHQPLDEANDMGHVVTHTQPPVPTDGVRCSRGHTLHFVRRQKAGARRRFPNAQPRHVALELSLPVPAEPSHRGSLLGCAGGDFVVDVGDVDGLDHRQTVVVGELVM